MDKMINLEGRINSNNIQDIESKILEDIKSTNKNHKNEYCMLKG